MVGTLSMILGEENFWVKTSPINFGGGIIKGKDYCV